MLADVCGAPARLRFSVAPEASRLLRARDRIRDYLTYFCAESTAVDDVVLAIEEACTNAIRHSGSSEAVEICLAFEGDCLSATVTDRGHGFDISSFDPARVPDLLATGGRGLFLISHLMDEMELHLDGGLQVRMLKRHVLADLAELPAHDGLPDGATLTGDGYRQARQRSMLEEIGEAYVALDWQYRILYANQFALELYGIGGPVAGRSLLEVFPHLEEMPLSSALRDAIELGRPAIIDYQSQELGRWFECRAYPTSSGLSIYVRDIEARKRKELERDHLLEALHESEARVRRKLESIVSPHGDASLLELSDLIDAAAMQTIMDDFYALARLPMSIVDVEGNVLVGVGWQEICTSFHRIHPETCRHCLESDTELSAGLQPGEHRLYRCKNNMWDMVTPIVVDGRHLGNIFTGQFFFEDELIDREFFQRQARQYGFDEAEYLAALDGVPRLSRQDVEHGMAFFVRLAETLSQLAFSNTAQARLLNERDLLTSSLRQTQEQLAERARLAEALNQINRRVHSTLEADRILQQALDEAVAALGVDAGLIELRQQGAWFVRFQQGLGAAVLGERIPEADSIARRVLDARSTITFDALTAPAEIEAGVLPATGHVLCVPLFDRDEVIGALLFHNAASGAFGAEESDFATKLGATISLALANVRLHERESEAARLGIRLAGGRLRAVITSLRSHRLQVLLIAAIVAAAFLLPLGLVKQTVHILGIPGSLLAAEVAIAGALAGPLVGSLSGAIGGAIFFVSVADFGRRSSYFAVSVSTAMWIIVGLIAGVLAQALREETERRLHASVTLARAETARSEQLAIEREREGYIEELQAQGEELQVQTEELRAQTDELEAQREELGTVIEQTEACIVLLDRNFNFLLVNSAYAKTCGYEPAQMVGLNHFALYPDEENEAIFRRVRDTGEAVEYLAKPFEFPDQPERAITYWDWRLAPIKDHDGRVTRLVFSLVEVTERIRSAQLSQTLIEIDALLHSSLEFDQIMQRALKESVRALRLDGGTVETRGASSWSVRYEYGFGSAVLGRELSAGEAPISSRVRKTNETLAIGDMAGTEFDVAFVREHRLRAVIAVPLMARGELIGCLLLFGKDPRSFAEAEIDFARKLGATASLALENASLYDSQRQVATTLQKSFIHPLPQLSGLRLAVLSLPAGREALIGGDFHDVFELPSGAIVAMIGDVTGKGVQAAALTETVRAAVRTLAFISPTPEYILQHVNTMLMREGEHHQLVTALLLVLDPKTGQGYLASAGHPPAVHLSDDGCRLIEPVYGLPLGALEQRYEQIGFVLAPNDALLVYTDGLTEARQNGSLFGEARLLRLLGDCAERNPEHLVEHLRVAVQSFAAELKDDLQILALHKTAD